MIRSNRKAQVSLRVRPPALGFTLIELMLVIVLLAIFLILALPAYTRQVQSSQRSIASTALMSTMARQQQFFGRHGRFAGDLTELGYVSSPYALNVNGKELESGGADRIYLIELTTADRGYLLLAAPQLGQVSDVLCGTLSLTSLGVQGVSGHGEVSRCW